MNDRVAQHDWGYELKLTNKEDYCGKILVFSDANKSTKLHLHKEKDKTFFVNAGKFTIMYIDYSTGKIYEQVLEEGQTFNVLPMVPCKLTSMVNNSSITEISNTGSDDTYYLS